MKKFLLLIPALFCFSSIMAQDFSVGPKVGVSQGNVKVNGEGFSSGESKLGYHLGAFVRMGGSSIFVQPEFLFTQTGGQIIESTTGNDDVFDVDFNRFDIPMMFGFKLAKFFRVQAGPVASILLDYKLEDAIQNAVELDYRSSSLGYQAGIGLDIGNLILDLKFENSLSKIAKSVAGFNTDQRQNQLILSAGFRLF